jgi:hypothetical protein
VLIRTPNGIRSLYTDYTVYLPKRTEPYGWVEPGDWMPEANYYLTSKPAEHGLPGDVVFEAEGRDLVMHFDDQYIFRSIRLLKEVG